jgi:hypothetical protein
LTNNAQQFKSRLASSTRLSESAITAAWPEWWSDAADASPSALAELRFSLARQLGLDPRSLLEGEQPRFVWDDSAKYKNFKGDDAKERPAISSFGMSVGRIMIKATPHYVPLEGLGASGLRQSILATKPFVSLIDLLGFLWGIGIPVIHLRVFPLAAKRMCAMAVRIRGRHAILLAQDAQYPAKTAFHLAHEIGHIALGHVGENSAVVDMEDPSECSEPQDDEETVADRYALELLTGDPDFKVGKSGKGHNPHQLAEQATKLGVEYGIEPGTLALCFGYETNDWATVQLAFAHIYTKAVPVWTVTNNVAKRQLEWEQLSEERASFLSAVMGGP